MRTELSGLDLAIVAVYFLAMLGLGAVLSTRIREFKDYFLAGGALTTPLLVCTLVSTYYELDVTFAVSEQGYYHGLVSWVWLSRPYYVAIILATLLVAPRLKRFEMMTLPDLLEHQYGKNTRVVGALACFVYSLPITALAGLAVMFRIIGVPPGWGMAVTVGVCVVYTALGGLWADALSDTLQFLLMCVALAVAIPVALRWVGGFGFTEHLPAQHLTGTGGLSGWLIVAWTLGALTVFVEPAFYQRIFAAESTRAVTRAMLIGVVLWAAYDWGVTMVGMMARAAVESGLLAQAPAGKEALMVVCMKTLPVGLRGLFIGGVLAAAMSSIDSYSLLASSNLVYDIYRPLRQRPLADRTLTLLTRGGVFAVMILGMAVSVWFERILDAWVFMSSVLVSVVFVPVMGALFGHPRRGAGVWAAGAGLAALVIFYLAVHWHGVYDEQAESWVWRLGGFEWWREYAVLGALPVSFLGFVAGHLWGKARC